jgi:hypothetical protein
MNIETLRTMGLITLWAMIIKALFIGSQFNFYYWIKYGKKYIQWYDDEKRRSFKLYLKNERKKECTVNKIQKD